MSDSASEWIDNHPILLVAIMFLVITFGALALWVGSSYFEAAAFNRVTGKAVSTFDAMWIELRVQEQSN